MFLRQAQQAVRRFNCSNSYAQEKKRRFSKSTSNRNGSQGTRTSPTFKLATLNICGLGQKIMEIVNFMKKHTIQIMGLSDCRKRGQNIQQIHEDYVLIWSGVNTGRRATHGVGFIVHPSIAHLIDKITYVSSRIISVRFKDRNKQTSIVQVYAPCNDNTTNEENDDFYNELSSTLHSVLHSDDLIVMGDFNGKVGKRRPPWNKYLGPFSDTTKDCNKNGERILHLCAEHELFITNTFYNHRRSQTQTWYKWGDLGQSSQIDFILTKCAARKHITDSKVIPSVFFYTDHRPVVLYMGNTSFSKISSTKPTEVINIKKLLDEETRKSVEQQMKIVLYQQRERLNSSSIETNWQIFKKSLQTILKETCGVIKKGGKRKKTTMWWNEQVKAVIKDKKVCFKKWLKTRTVEDYTLYKQARQKAKNEIRISREESWTKYGNILNELSTNSPRHFFKRVKSMRLRGECFNPSTTINDVHGRAIYGVSEIKTRWETYFKELLNPETTNDQAPVFTPAYEDYEEPEILEQEVREATKRSHNNKATGIDNIPIEAIKACHEVGIKWMTKIFNQAWKERKVPEDWQRAVIVPIWKNKGSKKECSQYRGISLLSHVGKIFARILEQRVRYIVEPSLNNSQYGFRKGRGCTDAIFTLRQMSEKTIEYNNELNVAFIDQEKAFDRVNRDKLWAVLEEYGVKGQLLDNIRALYHTTQCAIRTTVGMTNWFPVSSGVRQGCILSPLLFIIYMDAIAKEANPQQEDINELIFADDHALIYKDKDNLQHHINSLNACCKKYNMKINIEKTELLTVNKTPVRRSITIEGKALQQAGEFKYLGSVFSEDGKLDREIENRIQKASNVSYQIAPLLRHPCINMHIKMQLIKALFVPTLCYQCQTWTVLEKHKRTITTCEMRCIRNAAGKTRRDRITNEELRKMVGTVPVNDFIEHQRIKWFGHLVRMEQNQPAARAYYMRETGYRSRGRPKKRWVEGVKEALRKRKMNIIQATHLAKDRKLHPTPLCDASRHKQ